MNPLYFLLLLVSNGSSIAGQVFFKRGMGDTVQMAGWQRASWVGTGIVAKALSFFCWILLLYRFELSYIYPFEALDPIFVALAAALFLREKLNFRLLLGISIICAGIAIVSIT
jgi:undecaprenyl phosphate-alpha-L-ara4N flippase subunit ArnE